MSDEPLEALEFSQALDVELEEYLEEGVSVAHLVSAMFCSIGTLLVQELGFEQAQEVFEDYARQTSSTLWMAGDRPAQLN